MPSIDLMGRVVGRPSGWEERRSDAGHAIVEEVAENVEGIELALATRAKQRRQDLLRLRAEPRAIAARDFPIHDGRAECLFGTPVSRVDRRVVQETEERRPLPVQMRGKPPHGRHHGGLVEDGRQACLQLAARDRHAMGRDRAGRVPVPQVERLLQHGLYPVRERGAWMIGLQLATATQQVRQARLMRRLLKLPIGGPAVPHEHTRKIGPEQGRRLLEAATRLNGVDSGAWRRTHPQPLQLRAHAPAGFVGHDHRTLPDRLDQRRIGRRGLTRGAMEGVDDAAGRHRQPEVLLKEGRDLADRHAELRMQDGSGGRRARANLRGRRTECVGRLQRMPALHAAPTALTLPNVHMKRAHDRPHRREVFLVLRRQARGDHRARTARTRGRERRVVGVIDVCRDGTVCGPAIRRTGLATRASRVGRRSIFRKRRRLSTAGSPCRLEFRAQTLVLAPQPFVLPPQRLALPLCAFGAFAKRVDLVARRRRIVRWSIRHADVMPDPRKKYKYGILDRSFREVSREARTR